MADAGVILETLERAGELCSDPAPAIYARLFELRPEFEALFVMDVNGGVRGNMLATSIDCLIGVAEGRETPRLLIEAARIHHDGYDLSGSDLDLMFVAIRDALRGMLGSAWSKSADREWAILLEELATIHAEGPA